MKQIESIKALVADAEREADKFNRGNKAAGTRLRKAMQEIKVLCQEVRQEVTKVRGG